MNETHKGINYDLAKAEADKVDEEIIAALQNGNSFRVEAGAGSGKTYSLNKAIEWLQTNKWAEYRRKKQTVVCITYTNAAVDVIAERLSKDSFILPSTIHSFAWNAIKQYQSFLIDIVTNDPDFLPDEGDFLKVTEVTYTLGHRYKENGIQSFLELDYLQFIAAIDFLFPDAMFSTEHGVKGEEYDNVVFVISKGWNLYQFETYAPMITGHVNVPEGKQASYERNRNLFYVCCSRPKKRLFFFVSVPIDAVFRAFLTELVGTDNIYTYSQYLKTDLQ